MTSKMIALVAALAFTLSAAPIANAAKPMHHRVAHHAGKACKGEFMYMKGGKCMDARDKPAKA